MKATKTDYELAMRFPEVADSHGFAKSAPEAKLNPQQTERLLALGLIVFSRQNNAVASPTDKPGRGSFLRRTDHYIRTFKDAK